MQISSFQLGVGMWMLKCFGAESVEDKAERGHRFLEEALELVQSVGLSKEDVIQLVDYTYGRPVGEPEQEVGGVMVTLSALCSSHQILLSDAAVLEFKRINEPEVIVKIRDKQATKPKNSPLPETVT